MTPSSRHLVLQYLPLAQLLSPKSQGAPSWCPARIKGYYSRGGWRRGEGGGGWRREEGGGRRRVEEGGGGGGGKSCSGVNSGSWTGNEAIFSFSLVLMTFSQLHCYNIRANLIFASSLLLLIFKNKFLHEDTTPADPSNSTELKKSSSMNWFCLISSLHSSC